MKKMQQFYFVGIAIALLDQLTKFAVQQLAAPVMLTSFLQIRLSHNAGSVFGLFKSYAVLLTILTLLVVVLIPVYRKQLAKFSLPVSLIWGGALGNLIDRLASGAVRDFIAFSFWPSFNVADAAITVGVVWVVWMEWKHR